MSNILKEYPSFSIWNKYMAGLLSFYVTVNLLQYISHISSIQDVEKTHAQLNKNEGNENAWKKLLTSCVKYGR